ncbi:protein FAR1-RELATED SEQUENCE 5-like [Camellia sinensis]|uniref:protein FAR1-RELATED SEQUENCE 5-like n=1 Tax=Camellia sinensis TaxID=4442 RepID=UPI0010363FC7|nr:protein FAR1-RELATED SEQUENCE 5-like [Camellia sinensis]
MDESMCTEAFEPPWMRDLLGPNRDGNPNLNIPDYKPRIGLEFDSLDDAKKIYNEFGRITSFSVRIEYSNTCKKTERITSRRFVCSKEGFRCKDNRDIKTKKPCQETRTGCEALMTVLLNKKSKKYEVTDFFDDHNHPLHIQECVHLMPSQRKITKAQAIEADLVEASGIRLRSSFELAFRQTGGRECLGFTCQDLKNYLWTKRQRDLKFGEAGSLLVYFADKSMKDSSFHFNMQLDVEEQITNIFWVDPKMIIDYSVFGDFVSFDTTYRTHKGYRLLAVFLGFNNYRKNVIFGAALLYGETVASFEWLFRSFLDAMSGKKPKTFFTDQDSAMAKAISLVMPDTFHRICTWHMKQNAIKHLGSKYVGDHGGIGAELSKFIYNYEDEENFCIAWEEMLDRFDVHDNSWLPTIYGVREKRAKPYVMTVWSAWADTTQHFERVVDDINHMELECEYASRQKLPRIGLPVPMLINTGDFYTNQNFELFKIEYLNSLRAFAWKQDESNLSHDYMVKIPDEPMVREVKANPRGPEVSCTCRLFERCGILCSHALKGLDMMNMKEILESYLLKRWAKKAKDGLVQENNRCVAKQVVADLDMNARYRMLCLSLIKLGCRVAESKETTCMLMKNSIEMAKKIDDVLSKQASVNEQENDSRAPSCPQKSSEKVAEENQPHNPHDNMPLYVPVFEDKNMDQSPLHPLSVEIPNSMSWMIPETPQAWNHLSFTHLLQESLLCPSIEDSKGSSSAQYSEEVGLVTCISLEHCCVAHAYELCHEDRDRNCAELSEGTAGKGVGLIDKNSTFLFPFAFSSAVPYKIA